MTEFLQIDWILAKQTEKKEVLFDTDEEPLRFNKEKLTFRRIITILRQCLKPLGYTIKSHERYTNSGKVIEYNIELLHDEKKKQIEQKKCTIVFDWNTYIFRAS